MNIERYLREYPLTGNELIRLNHELNTLISCRDESYCTLGAQTIDDMPKVKHWEACSTVEKAAWALMDTKLSYDILIKEYVDRINDIIDKKKIFEDAWGERGVLSSLEKRIVQLRCFDEMSWDHVCKTVYYSRRQCNYIMESAVKKLQNAVILGQVMKECLMSS